MKYKYFVNVLKQNWSEAEIISCNKFLLVLPKFPYFFLLKKSMIVAMQLENALQLQIL